MYRYITCLCFLCVTQLLHSQQCEVIPATLKGTYAGECKKGKAQGTGKAVGEDSYVGNFKSGIPDGEGTYTWKNGSSYIGKWSNGLRDGNGSMKFKLANGSDSLVTGFWKKDVYLRRYETPYKIYSKTGNVREVNIEFKSSDNSSAKFVVTGTSGGGLVRVDNIQIVTGGFMQQNFYDLPRRTETVLLSLDLPFRAKYIIRNDEIEIEFFEKGIYIINIYINN